MQKRRGQDTGFTLVEVMMVVAIIGIMAAVVAPNFMSWLPNMRLKGAARELYSNMQKARMMAVKMNRNTALVFTTTAGNENYAICDDWDDSTDDSTTPASCNGTLVTLVVFNTLGSGISYGHGNSGKQADDSGSSWPNPSSPADNVTYGNNSVVFNSQGLGNTGYVYLDHQDHTTTYAIGSQSSGVIKLLKWNGSKWQ